MERGRGRGRRLGTKASRPMLDFEGDDKEKASPEKVQSKLDAFTVRQDELKAPVQVSTRRDDDKDYDPQEEDADDDDDDEVRVVQQRVTGRTLRLVNRHTVDEESIALDIRLGKFGLNPAELEVMSKDDKKLTLQIFQQSQQDNEVTQQKKRAFCKEADIDYEDLELEQGNVAKNKQSKSEAISAAQGAPDEDETQAPEDDFMTFGQTLNEDAAHKSHYENGEDGTQHGAGEEAGIGNPQDEEETQPYELDQDLFTRLVTKKRSFQRVQEADENNEGIPKKSKVEEDDSPRPRFHFEYDENEDLPPPSPILAKLVNKRRLKQKRPKRPFLMFTSSGQSPVEYKKKIIQYFDEYFLTLRDFQRRSSTMLEWGAPVCEGRSMPDSLDVFSCKPARPVYIPAKPLSSDDESIPPKQKTLTIDDVFGFESLDEPKPSNSRADRYEKRNRHRFGEYEDIIEDDDFTRDPDFTMAPKPAPKKGRGKGRGKNPSSKETNTLKEACKSTIFDKSAAAGAADSDEILPDLIIESDDTPPLPADYGDNNSIDFDGLAADQSATTAETPQLLHGGSDEDSDSKLAPATEKTDTNSRSVELKRGGVNIGLGRSKSPVIMDIDEEEEDIWMSCAGKKRSSFLIDDSAKQRIKVALKTSCENISSSRENSQNEETDIPAEKLTLTKKIIRTFQSIVRPASKSQEDKTRKAAEYDLNRRPGDVQTVRASDDHSPQASQDLFSNNTQDDPIPSPTFPGRGRHIGGSDTCIGTDGSKSHVKSSGPVLPGGFVRTKNEPNSEFDEPEWFVQEQDPDAATTNYLDKSEADVKRTARPKRGGSRSASNGTRDKPAPRHVNVTRTKVDLSDDEDDVQVHHKKQSVCRRKNAAGAAVEKTHRGDDGEIVSVASSSRGTGRRVIRPPQKKRKVETEAIPVLESEEEEEPVPQMVNVEPQVDCPLCGNPYPQSMIEAHASECNGMSQKSDQRQTRSSANTQESQQPDRRNRQPDVRYRKVMTARFSSSDSDSDVPGPPSLPTSLYGNRSVVPDHRPEEDLFDMERQMTVPRRARQPKPVVDGEACYICDGIFSKGKEYEEHVNSCMDAQKEQQRRIMQSFSKERSQSVDDVDGGGEPGQSGHERQSNSDDDASEESGGAGDSDSSDATTGEDDNHDHDDPGPAFKREDENDFDWDNISSSPIKTFRPFSKHQGGLLIDLNKQFPHQRKTVELNNQRSLSEFGVRGGARGGGRGRGRGAKKPPKRRRKTKQKTKSRKKAKTVKKGPSPVHFS